MTDQKNRVSRYKETRIGLLPIEWDCKSIGKQFIVKSGGTPSRGNPDYWNGNIPWITTGELNFNHISNSQEKITEDGLINSSAKLFPPNTVLIAMYGQGITRGKSAILSISATTNQACAAILPNQQSNSYFLFKFLEHSYHKIRNLSNDGSQKNLSGDLIKGIPIPIPSLQEQDKIAEIIRVWDHTIGDIEKLITLKKQRKKGLIQQLMSGRKRIPTFGKAVENKNEIPDGWTLSPLSDFLYENKERNKKGLFGKKHVLSVSGEFGIVNQIDFMGRSYAGKSVDNYHVVNPGDIVYTKSPLKSNPYGIIKVNEGVPGIVSTLYAVYSCKPNITGKYLDYYFQSDDHTNCYLRPLVKKGAKNDMKVNNGHVLTGKILIPPIEEQNKIVGLLEVVDSEIAATKLKLEKLKTQKKGLMQRLLTGEVRVKV